jgi:hypothetical protein
MQKQEEYLKDKSTDVATISKDREKFESDYQRNKALFEAKYTTALKDYQDALKARDKAQASGSPGLSAMQTGLYWLNQDAENARASLQQLEEYHVETGAGFDEWIKQAGIERERKARQRGGGTSGTGAGTSSYDSGGGTIEQPLTGARPGAGGLPQAAQPGGAIPPSLPAGMGNVFSPTPFYNPFASTTDESTDESEDRDNEYDDNPNE